MSSVVVGSSARAGLSIETSVRAVIDGTIAANARLTRLNVLVDDDTLRPATDIVSFRVLEFIERYEDRVDLIVSVLGRMEQAAGQSGQGVRQHVTYSLPPGAGRGAVDGDIADRRGERELAAGRHRRPARIARRRAPSSCSSRRSAPSPVRRS